MIKYNKVQWIVEFTECTIDKINGQNILVVSFCATTPHLEASLEICRRLSELNKITYTHLAHHISRPTFYSKNIFKRKLQLPIRVLRAKQYLAKYNSKYRQIEWLETTKLISQINKIYDEYQLNHKQYRFPLKKI